MFSRLKKIRDLLMEKRIGTVENYEQPLFFSSKDKKRLLSFENKYVGKRCFVIGNGPSLNVTPLELIKDEITFGFNGIYKNNFGFKPDFLLSTDYRVFDQFDSQFSSFYKVAGFFPVGFKRRLSKSQDNYFFKVNRGFHLEKSPNYKIPRFSTCPLSRIYEAPSVIYYALQLIYFMGFDEVYLLGVDFDYSKNSHFINDYKDKCNDWNQPESKALENCFYLAKSYYEQADKQIFDSTIGGKLTVFNKKELNEIF